MTQAPRAFTIVEVLLATALLAILAAASAGLLREAARLSQPEAQQTPATSGQIVLLGVYADLVLERPEDFGLTASPNPSWDGAHIDAASIDPLLSPQQLQASLHVLRVRVAPDGRPTNQPSGSSSNAWLIFAAVNRSDRLIAEVARRVYLPQEDTP